MQHPPGYSLGPPGTVCRLRKSLYGMKQSPRMWFWKFTTVMRAQGYTQSNGTRLSSSIMAQVGSPSWLFMSTTF